MKKIVSCLISLIFLLNVGLAYTSKVTVKGISVTVNADEGSIVEIDPTLPEVEGWEVKKGNTTVVNNQFVMPKGDVEIEGIIAAASTYMLTIDLPYFTSTELKAEGEIVTVEALDESDELAFSNWTTTGLTLDEAQKVSSSITFTMPGNPVNLVANYLNAPNAPQLVDGLKAVNWNTNINDWEEVQPGEKWDYNYDSVAKAIQSKKEGDGAGKWANARTADGSMYVWIPRYTYKIASGYHQSGNSWNANPQGTNKIEIRFSDGTVDSKDNVTSSKDGFIAHPAFTFGNQEVTGIWIAKYEASKGNVTEELAIPSAEKQVIKSVPGVSSWIGLTVSQMYTHAFNSFRNAESHLMKNSEWGAVAYLTSAIGRIPYINNNSSYITGSSGSTQNGGTALGWDNENAVKASTTHNVYGIYDMSGGTYEYVAGYVDNNHSNLGTYAQNLVANKDTKYVEVYPTGASDTAANNYNAWINKNGDAIYETSNSSSGTTSWDGDYSSAPNSGDPVFVRSGGCKLGDGAGIFSSYSRSGSTHDNHGFRSVCVIPPEGTTPPEPEPQPTTNTVTLNNQGATVAGTTSVTATNGSAMPSITKPQKQYTVTYNHNYSGSSNTTGTATYTFGGYYTETNGNGTQYYTENGASAKNWDKTSDTTLYAKWTAGSVTLPTPTRTGFDFKGWHKEAGCQNLIGQGGAPYTPTANTTLYAKWEKQWPGWNEPQLVDGLTPVNWSGSAWAETTVENWDYNYNSVAQATQSTVEGNGAGKWANAKDSNGSYYVWIPRYTYKIKTGHHASGNSWNGNPKGSNQIEIRFSNGTVDNKDNVSSSKDGFIAHPAFNFGGTQLEGIWVAKYEASNQNNVAVSKPGVASWRNLTVSDIYMYAYNSFRKGDSHLLKNTEWGAVAYLTNAIGRIPYINNNQNYITGIAGDTQDSAQTTSTANTYNTQKGVKASTTHNVYGIYDMSGGAWEYVAAYYDSKNNTNINNLANADSKYKNLYTSTYAAFNYGDAVYETSISGTEGQKAWDTDDSFGPNNTTANIFLRGGAFGYANAGGIFCFGGANGAANNYSFRTALCIPSSDNQNEIIFSKNDGSGETKKQLFNKNETKNLTLNSFTRSGYTFLGWSRNPQAKTAEIQDGESFTFSYSETLYAVWKAPWNEPQLVDGLTPVNWSGSAWATTTVENWDYNYNSVAEATQSTVQGNGAGKWANAKDSNGSYYVWIPRYTYKITTGYHTTGNSWNGNPKGSNQIEIKFSNGVDDYVDNVANSSLGYIKHPAFTFGTQEVEGIWVAKYEMSRSNATETSVGTTDKAISQPGVQSWRDLTVSDMYTKAFNSFRNADSHLMKNSEWGAVAYLTNAIGRIPYINNNNGHITGIAGDTQDSAQTTSTANTYNTSKGVKASTTHNVYGIYDMSGGAWEYIAAYVDNNHTNLGNYAQNLVANKDTKYVELYPIGDSDAQTNNYNAWINIKGDAVYETSSSGSGSNSWDGDYSYASYVNYPNFLRGGYYGAGSDTGIFYFNPYDGSAGGDFGFRTVCVILSDGVSTQITFKKNDGTDSSTTQPFTMGETKALATNTFTRPGYNFLGWARNADAKQATIQDGENYTCYHEETLYAVWKKQWPGWNEPKLVDGLTPVNWSGSAWATTTVENWDYNYNSVAEANQSTVQGNGKWANAKDSNGSYYVWIPRYTYKITTGYHKRGKSWTAGGNNKIEIKFSNGVDDYVDNVANSSLGYIKHPAFTFGTDEVEGIWVAKYEMSNKGGVAVSEPGVQSWRGLTVSDMYTKAFNSFRNGDSHLIKNSEWGAVAYLTNAIGRIPYINNSSDCITGNAGNSQDTTQDPGITNAWNTYKGVKASTTHNVYGIYDMSGGAREYVAAYVDNNHTNLGNFAQNLVANKDTKYVEVYPIGASDTQTNNYNAWINIKGDAVYETSLSADGFSGYANGWDVDYSIAPDSYSPVFLRGGDYANGIQAGVFHFIGSDGTVFVVGFRSVLVIP